MQNNTVMGESRIGSHYLPDIRKCRNALVIFLLLQVYFTGNILSFGFWKSELVVFGYLAMFYGVWLVGLSLLLSLCLITSARFNKTRFDPVILIIFSLPLCFGLWLQTLEVGPHTLWWVAIPIIFHHVCLLPFRRFVCRQSVRSHGAPLYRVIPGSCRHICRT